MKPFPFTAIVGSDDMGLALTLTAVSPAIGGVLVRGEKGTAKSTMVRALADVLPTQQVMAGCRFGCEPAQPDPTCPDTDQHTENILHRPSRLVELPVGATEDRVIGSLDLEKALGAGEAAFEPGLLAEANRGILYVDEVNLLHDHLVDLLLDAAAMGRNTVERDGVSVSHAARIVLVGTMNPEEGELRPQLLDRFGLTVEVAAPREPGMRTEVVRRRLAYEADPDAFASRYGSTQEDLARRIVEARTRLAEVVLTDWSLAAIARVCAGFDVDGMRADIVTARTAMAHAAWQGRDHVVRADVRAAARLTLPHRRRRNPFDAPGLDEELLDRLLDDDPEPPDPERPDGPDDPAPNSPEGEPAEDQSSPGSEHESSEPDSGPAPEQPQTNEPTNTADDGPDSDVTPLPVGVAEVGEAYRTRTFTAEGVGRGAAGRRSRAITSRGRRVGVTTSDAGPVHVPATVRAAAPHQAARGREGRLLLRRHDLRRAVTEGRESNLVLFCVDASGSMAARRRMASVKTAVLSLLLDAYQRRDKVGLISFRGADSELLLPPTSSVDAAARRLTDLAHGGRTPLAEGLLQAGEVLRLEKLRDPDRRALLVVISDGRATHGADAIGRAEMAAAHLRSEGIDSIMVDCETGRFRMGLARRLATALGARLCPLDDLADGGSTINPTRLADTVRAHRAA